MDRAVAPFAFVDAPNYAITEELLAALKSGNRTQTAQAQHLLRSVIIGFDGVEIPKSNIGMPHYLLLGMTNAERLGVYSGIDVKKQDSRALARLGELPTEDCISELVKAAFSNTPGPLQLIARQGSSGYDTGRGALVGRMQQVLQQFPEAYWDFRKAAISTIRPLYEDIQHVNRLDLDALIEGIAGRFEWKYQKEVRAAQAATAAARK